MTKQKANQLADYIIDLYHIDKVEKENLLHVLRDYGVYKENKFENYKVEGQMDIMDFPEYLPEDMER